MNKKILSKLALLSLLLLPSIEAAQVTNTQPLGFDAILAGFTQTITTDPIDPQAAIFTADGTPNTNFKISVVENSILMFLQPSGSHDIKVELFKFGGDLDKQGRGRFGATGLLNNIRIGARARVRNDDPSGPYAGTGTLRLTYL